MYDREAAIRYAHKWAFYRNPNYMAFDNIGGDCTNFVSQCLYAGGCAMNNTPEVGWYYRSSSDRSAPWSSVNYLYQFLMSNQGPGPYGEELPLDQAQPGDIIQFNLDGGKFAHSTLIVETGDNPAPENILVAAHNVDSDNRQMSSYEYKDYRTIHIRNRATSP